MSRQAVEMMKVHSEAGEKPLLESVIERLASAEHVFQRCTAGKRTLVKERPEQRWYALQHADLVLQNEPLEHRTVADLLLRGNDDSRTA